MKINICLILALIVLKVNHGQDSKYTEKHFVSRYDNKEFKSTPIPKDGFSRNYLRINIPIWDVDDNNTAHVRGHQQAIVALEGNYKNKKREGKFTAFLIDSFDHKKLYKIWEQQYQNDKLNGQWKTYNLQGVLVKNETYLNDSLNGTAREYWIDGKTVMGEWQFFNGRRKAIQKEFFPSGKLAGETMFENGMANGPAKRFYETGGVKEQLTLKNGKIHGLRTYYYQNGKPWIEQEYQDGKAWNVIANYDSKGKKRNPGTLRNGTGTIILYDDDTTIRETLTYRDGIQLK